jgi:very-short-patch-repair endonuclease
MTRCDGHAFHERTKEQAKRDRSRDRGAQLHGLPIFRFTGSEIWNDPMGCADEVLEFMERDPEARKA